MILALSITLNVLKIQPGLQLRSLQNYSKMYYLPYFETNPWTILQLSRLKAWLPMVASTVKNANDHLRKGNKHRRSFPATNAKARQYLACVPGFRTRMERGFWARDEGERTLPPRAPLAFLSRSAHDCEARKKGYLKVLQMLNENMN